jgi:hypothetical protein
MSWLGIFSGDVPFAPLAAARVAHTLAEELGLEIGQTLPRAGWRTVELAFQKLFG